jgi:hypothetical protein
MKVRLTLRTLPHTAPLVIVAAARSDPAAFSLAHGPASKMTSWRRRRRVRRAADVLRRANSVASAGSGLLEGCPEHFAG